MIVTVGLLGTLPNQGLTKNRYKYNVTWGHPLFSLGTKLSRPHQSILSKSRFIVMSTIKIHVVDWNLIFPFQLNVLGGELRYPIYLLATIGSLANHLYCYPTALQRLHIGSIQDLMTLPLHTLTSMASIYNSANLNVG